MRCHTCKKHLSESEVYAGRNEDGGGGKMTNEIADITFRSVPENYWNELSGAKPNTVRIVTPDDARFYSLEHRTAKRIRIVNSETEDAFCRDIINITFWDGRFIISWKHPHEHYCENERPPRKVLCQKPSGHESSHSAVIFWE